MREAVVSFKLPNFDRAQLRCWLFVTVYWSAIAEAHRSRQMPRFTRKTNDEHPLFSDAFSVNERIGIEIKLQEMLKRVSFMVNKQYVANDQGFRLK